jgi:SAM-dependent methyltransferase
VADRATWLAEMRRQSAEQEDGLATAYDERWGEIDDLHREFVGRLLDLLPPEPHVLDAACGTGNYFGLVLDRGGSIVGVDHADGALRIARTKHPEIQVRRLELQELAFRNAFDGVLCVDAMEFVPPEDWPGVLRRFRAALHPEGALYLTVEPHDADELRRANEAARRAGHPVIEGEVLWQDESGEYYHHHPGSDAVRSWLEGEGFTVTQEREGPWDGGYAYHHLLCRQA